MKKLFTPFFALCLFFTLSLQAQEVAQVQKSVITKRTATWCPYCGTWGWELFEGLIEDNSEKAVLIAAHFGGSQLETTTSAEYLANLGGAGQPRFFLNNELQSASSSTIPDTRAAIKQQVDANYLLQPLANAGSYSSFDGTTLNIQTRTVFFQQAEGEYYLGVYLIEDGVLNSQAGQSGEVMHHYVMRDAATDNTFGVLLDSGTIPANTEYTHNFSADVSGYVPENLDVVTIIWRKEGDTYYYVNAWSEDAGNEAPSAVTELPKAIQVRLQTPESGQRYRLQVQSQRPLDEVQISLSDSNGRLLRLLHKGPLPAGESSFEVAQENLPKGIYFLNLHTAQGENRTLKIVFAN